MAAGVTSRHGETTQHARLKQLAFIWAQTHGFSACAMEVTLPRCRYRADVAGYRSVPKQIGSTAVFECKQALCDLRRDNCHSEAARRRLEAICNRRQLLEARLRTHYPNLHNGDSLFPEFDSENFSAIGHRGYARLVRELQTLQNRLYDCTKFEKLIRYRCANLFFIVLPEQLFRESEVPCRLGRSGRIKRHTYTRPQTDLARVHSRQSPSRFAPNRHGGNTELKSRTLARLARANCARSFLSVAANRAEIKESARHPPESRLRSGTSPHRWQHK